MYFYFWHYAIVFQYIFLGGVSKLHSARNPYLFLRMIWQVMLMGMKEFSAYRMNMVLTLVTGPLSILVQIFIWRAVFEPGTLIGGMSLTEMLTYFGASTLISIFIADQAANDLRWQVYTGSMITLLQRPINHLHFMFYQKLGQKVIAFVFEVLPLTLIIVFVFGINLIPSKVFWLVLSIALSFVLVYLVNYCIGLTAFWLISNNGLLMTIALITQLCTGALIPLTFFPGIIQKILFFLPFQYINYVPVRVFIGSYELAGYALTIPQIVGLQFVYVVVLFFITLFIWSKAMKKFTGAGA